MKKLYIAFALALFFVTYVKAQMHEWVDLGLPSGTLWATTNIGAFSAEYKGGNDALFNFLAQNLHYPEDAMESGIQGRVLVSFVIL